VQSRVRIGQSLNPCLWLLSKLYKLMARRAAFKVDKVISKRSYTSARNKAPVSISRLIKNMKNKEG